MNKKMNSRSFLFILAATVFAGCFVLAFGSSAIASAIRGFSGESQPAPPSAEIARVSDSLRAELNPQTPASSIGFEQALNPFNDQSGVSNEVKVQAMPGAAMPGAKMPPMNQTMIAGLPNSPQASSLPIGSMAQPTPTIQLPAQMPQTAPNRDNELLESYNEREREKMLGKQPSGSSLGIYGVDDLRPVGIIGGKCSPKSEKMCHEVILLSATTKQVVYATPGARLRDGEVIAISDEGVTFQRDGGSSLKKSWSRKGQDTKKSDGGILNAEQKNTRKDAAPVQTARGGDSDSDNRQPLR